MQSRRYLTLVSILLLFIAGLTIRLYTVGRNPAGFFCDEASIGYNAFLIATTGKDEHGQPFPVYFRSFGDYRPPLPFYTAIPFVMVFGLDETAVRAATATVGSFSILIAAATAYLLMRRLTGDRHQTALSAILSAFLITISPWHIHMSRFGAEYIYLPFVVLVTVMLFLLAWDRPRYLPLSAAAAAMVPYTYLPGVIIGPILFAGLSVIGISRFRLHRKLAITSVIVYLLLTVPAATALANGTLLTRWHNIGVTEHTSPTEAASMFLRTYAAHFSPQFLFTKGDIDYPGHFIKRFSVRGMGELYFPDALFVPIGLIGFSIMAFRKKRPAWIPIFILSLYPLGSSITSTDGAGPTAFRSVLGAGIFPIFSACGIVMALHLLRTRTVRRVIVLAIVGIYTAFFLYFAGLYTRQYPLYSQDFYGWQFGPRDIMTYFLKHANNYSELIIIGNFNAGSMFITFYDPYNTCQGKCMMGSEAMIRSDGTQLVAVDASRFDQTPMTAFRPQRVISYPNGKPAFYIGTYLNPTIPPGASD